MKRKRSYLISPKWSLSSLLIGVLILLSYEAIREFSFPIVVHENSHTSIQACFTPGHKCQARVLDKIRNAKTEILVMTYSFTAKPIAQELVSAIKRGVIVKVIADKSQKSQEHSQISWLKNNAIPVYFDETVAISHNKVMIIDEHIVITGSYNWTNAAEYRNAENLLIVESPELAKQYKMNWNATYSKRH